MSRKLRFTTGNFLESPRITPAKIVPSVVTDVKRHSASVLTYVLTGYTAGRDHAAAQNIKAKAEFQTQYRSSVRDLGETVLRKPLEPSIVLAAKGEREQSRLGGDAVTLQLTSHNNDNFQSQQLSLNLGVASGNGFTGSFDIKTSPNFTKTFEPRSRSRKLNKSKDADGQGYLPLWEVG